ncbi:MAG: hypothetical protein Kow0090_02260 [Myxococcota bacterium]
MSIEGQKFGKYTLIDRLAVGGMAEIFLARMEGMEGFEKPAVIKRIRPHLSQQPSFVKMFLNEAKLAAQLNHSAIVQIYELGRIGESYFIAMEYVNGRDMSRIIPKTRKKNIPFPMEYALKIASNICEGLYYAHNKADHFGNSLNIVHRDVTPENILVSFDGNVKILDFGIAKADSVIESDTQAGEIKGKLSYLSPEQCKSIQLDGRSDIFSLGVMLYEWLTGFRLFSGENEAAVIKNILESKIYPPSYFKADIPKSVEDIVMKALEREREKRYQTAWDMQYDIDLFLSNHEFNPSNVHLANFLKQLFDEELEQDRKRLMKALSPNKRGGGADRITLSDPDSAPSAHTTPPNEHIQAEGSIRMNRLQGTMEIKGGGKLLKIAIYNEEYETLRQIADRHNIKVTELVKEILRSYLKYR